jgi:hypothetical protein
VLVVVSITDPDPRREVAAALVAGRHRRDSLGGIREIRLPERLRVRPLVAVGIEGVDLVLFGDHVDHVVRPLVRHADVRQIKGLRVDLARDEMREKLAETVHIDVRRRQDSLTQVLPGTHRVVVLGRDVDLCEAGDGESAECGE